MNNKKLTELKLFSQKNIFHSLINIKNNLPDDFISEGSLYTKQILKDKVTKIINCSSQKAISSDIDTNTGELITNVLYNNSCGQYVLCPICSRTRSEKIKLNYGEAINEQIKTHNSNYIYLITFTLDNRENFEHMYKDFSNAITSFMKMGQKRGKNKGPGEASKINSAIMGIEAKEGDTSGKWHVHGHMLAFCNDMLDMRIYDQEKKKKLFSFYPKRIPKDKLDKIAMHKVLFDGEMKNVSKLSLEWYKATKGSAINIELTPINDDNIEKQIREVIKYPTKLNKMPTDKMLDILLHKDRKRFLRVYGSLRGSTRCKVIDNDEKKLIPHKIETKKYVQETGQFIFDDEKLIEIAKDLNSKKDQLKDFLVRCTKVRLLKNELYKFFKQKVQEQGFLKDGFIIDDFKEDIIYEVDCIHLACKQFFKSLFDKLVRNSHDPDHEFKKPLMVPKMKRYFDSFIRYNDLQKTNENPSAILGV